MSNKFGYDRGTPIDRFWIESFLEKNKHLIRGHTLEITDDAYTRRFGGESVTKSDVLDIDPKNKRATIYGDIRNLTNVKSNLFDSIIFTQVLGMIDDYDSAIGELHRILKKGGTILVTTSCLSPTYSPKNSYWRYTPNGLRYAFEKHFKKSDLTISSYGNVLAGQCFWVGMSQKDLTEDQLKYNDPSFPCIATLVGIKK